MTEYEPKTHYRAPGTNHAWCFVGRHGYRTATRQRDVTCSLCLLKGRPPLHRRLLRR